MRAYLENVILCCMLIDKEKRDLAFSLLEENCFTNERNIIFEAICKKYDDMDIIEILNEISKKIDRNEAIKKLSDILYLATFINTKHIKLYINELKQIVEIEKRNKELLEEYKRLNLEIGYCG